MPSDETRAQLEAQKREIFATIRQLERDMASDLMDRAAFETARRRYEAQAAAILQRLDMLASESRIPTPARIRIPSRPIMLVIGAVVLAAAALSLGTALRARTGNAAITGDVGAAVSTPTPSGSPQLATAKRAVASRPRDVDARLELASVYLGLGDARNADRIYLQAARLDPKRPEGTTMHAMILGSQGQARRGLALIHGVERNHARYAKAWFVDGFLSARVHGGLPRAVRAWQHFLVLDPHSAIASEVRALIASARKAEHAQP